MGKANRSLHKNKKGGKHQKDIKKNKNSIVIKKDPIKKKTKQQNVKPKLTSDEINEKYPILKNVELMKKFLNVTITNNQKGRIRQLLKDSLKGTSDVLLPDVINNKIESIVDDSKELSETELRKVRILYNMLKTSLQDNVKTPDGATEPVVQEKGSETIKEIVEEDKADEKKTVIEKADTESKKEKKDIKLKGPKRYVVFVGNLPIGIEKESLMKHFGDVAKNIKDVRIPSQADKKSSIAYIELQDEASYELALSKNHSMLDNRRINVHYTTQSKSKISKTEAKGKMAKLVALQKTGKLLGSVPQNRKRSFRRKKQKEALARQQAMEQALVK